MITRRVKGKTLRGGLLAALFVLAASAASQAGPLNEPVAPIPDLIAQYITSQYSGGTLLATGSLTGLDTGSGKTSLFGTFQVMAKVDSSGQASVGSLVITSTNNTTLLMSTNLLKFAFDAAKGGALEFLFGSATGAYTVPGAAALFVGPIDVLLQPGIAQSGSSGNFATNWTSVSGSADVRSEGSPEPSSLLILLVGMIGAGFMWVRLRGMTAPALSRC